jgi:hypothetical protein
MGHARPPVVVYPPRLSGMLNKHKERNKHFVNDVSQGLPERRGIG